MYWTVIYIIIGFAFAQHCKWRGNNVETAPRIGAIAYFWIVALWGFILIWDIFVRIIWRK